MKRRLVLAGGMAGGAGLLLDHLAPQALDEWRARLPGAPSPTVLRPGATLGHQLRALTAPAHTGPGQATDTRLDELPVAHETDVLVAGSGAAGLCCAWALRQAGVQRLTLLEGPVPDGNCAHGDGPAGRYPLAAHYLPLPDRRSMHLRRLLADAGVLLEGLHDEAPRYDERAIVHAPVERVFHDGRWHAGLLPPLDENGQRQWQAFTDRLAIERQVPGRYGYPRPAGIERRADARALDALNFARWLDESGLDHPTLRWYLDYACRDDYGMPAAGISAWAGLNYFCGRHGQARDVEDGSVMTWPEGLGRLAQHLRERIGPQARRAGSLLGLAARREGMHEAQVMAADGSLQRWRARRVVLAMPLFVARRVAPWAFEGLEGAPGPSMQPWLVANVRFGRFPAEAPGEELAWDNVVAGAEGLGYVVATHQQIRQARPAQTVFTTYRALGVPDPVAQASRRQALLQASPDELLAMAGEDLRTAYGPDWHRHAQAIEIVVHGHAMAAPVPGFLDEPLARRAREAVERGDGLLFAHADLSGCSVFEEASWWGLRSAEALLGESGRWTGGPGAVA